MHQKIKRMKPQNHPGDAQLLLSSPSVGVGRNQTPKTPIRKGGMANIPKMPPKCPQMPPKRRVGQPGRHICNNLLNEAIIDTGKTRGGPCSAICLVFVFFFFLGGEETSGTKRTSFHCQRNTDLKSHRHLHKDDKKIIRK